MPKERDLDKISDAEIRELERSTAQMPRVVMVIFLGIGVLSLGIAIILTVGTVRGRAREVRVRGYVVEVVSRRDQQGNEFYYPVVTFTLPDGTRKTVQIAEGTWPQPYEVDQEVTVAYDPQRPLQARIASDGNGWLSWIGPLITGFLGLTFLGAALFVRSFFQETTAHDGKG